MDHAQNSNVRARRILIEAKSINQKEMFPTACQDFECIGFCLILNKYSLQNRSLSTYVHCQCESPPHCVSHWGRLCRAWPPRDNDRHSLPGNLMVPGHRPAVTSGSSRALVGGLRSWPLRGLRLGGRGFLLGSHARSLRGRRPCRCIWQELSSPRAVCPGPEQSQGRPPLTPTPVPFHFQTLCRACPRSLPLNDGFFGTPGEGD